MIRYWTRTIILSIILTFFVVPMFTIIPDTSGLERSDTITTRSWGIICDELYGSSVDIPFHVGEQNNQENQPPIVTSITVDMNEEAHVLGDGGGLSVHEDEAYIIFFTGDAVDDHTPMNRLIWRWNVSVPSGTHFEKNFRSWDLEIDKIGTYSISLMVTDDEGAASNEFTITIEVKPKPEVDPPYCYRNMIIAVSLVFIGLLGLIKLRVRALGR